MKQRYKIGKDTPNRYIVLNSTNTGGAKFRTEKGKTKKTRGNQKREELGEGEGERERGRRKIYCL